MSLLFSNFPPLRTDKKTYRDVFADMLQQSDAINVASGYVSSDSMVDLKNIVKANGGPRMNLCVGMHYFEGLSPVQLYSMQELDKTLREADLGQVHMVVTFPFHGKVVSFSKNDTVLASILGSSNLTNIVSGLRQYEVDYLFNGSDAIEINEFISDLITKTSKPFSELTLKATIPENDLLVDQLGVEKIKMDIVDTFKQQLTGLSFHIPLKGDASNKSGLNASFGKGRENKQGFIVPRSWYEVELIVPKEITTQDGYPQADKQGDGGVFHVVTDDGWKFRCKVSGDYSKNLRSDDDLKILGKWIKGRLENKGVLKSGERVTDDTLSEYGRNEITLTRTEQPDTWYLDFGV